MRERRIKSNAPIVVRTLFYSLKSNVQSWHAQHSLIENQFCATAIFCLWVSNFTAHKFHIHSSAQKCLNECLLINYNGCHFEWFEWISAIFALLWWTWPWNLARSLSIGLSGVECEFFTAPYILVQNYHKTWVHMYMCHVSIYFRQVICVFFVRAANVRILSNYFVTNNG